MEQLELSPTVMMKMWNDIATLENTSEASL